MVNKRNILFSVLFCTLFLGFKSGDEIEIVANFLNARSSANFLKTTKNLATSLSKGTTGKVTEVKNFTDKNGKITGNAGIKISIEAGPKKGQSYWVYFNKNNPALKLVDRQSKEEIPPEKVKPKSDTKGTIIRDTAAIRDPEEAVLEDTASMADEVVGKGVDTPKIKTDCPPSIPESPKTPAISANKESYSPEAALADLNSGDLKFVGRDLMPGSGQNRSCIYKNNKVYVIYGNCMSNKKESVMDMRIVSESGESIHFYMEDFKGRNTSSMKREEYSGSWRVTYNKVDRPKDMTMSQVKNYVESIESSTTGCWVGGDSAAPAKADCFGELKSKLSDWGPGAESFWQKPPADWYSTQLKMRKVIQATRF